MWGCLIDSNEELYDMRSTCFKNAKSDLLKSTSAWTLLTHSNKWVVCKMSYTDVGYTINKLIVFNKEFYVTINFQ